MKGASRTGALGAFRGRSSRMDDPANRMSFRDWLKQYTEDEKVLQLFHALTSAISTVNDFEYPISSFFAYISSAQGGLHYVGIAPRGNVELPHSLAETVKARGGEVWTNSPVEKIIIDQGRVKSVIINKTGNQEEIATRLLISDLGPKKTVELAGRNNFAADYLKQVDALLTAPIVHTLVDSDKPLMDIPGIAMIAGVNRVVTAIQMTNRCPELAPPGQHLMVVWGTPGSSLHHIDNEEEAKLNLEDIRTVFPDFDKHGRILWMDVRDIDHEFPAYRSWMGYDMPQETPLPNLFHVGDGVKPFGWEGTVACAQGARLIVDLLRKKFKPGKT